VVTRRDSRVGTYIRLLGRPEQQEAEVAEVDQTKVQVLDVTNEEWAENRDRRKAEYERIGAQLTEDERDQLQALALKVLGLADPEIKGGASDAALALGTLVGAGNRVTGRWTR
jgi:hypothetical protein